MTPYSVSIEIEVVRNHVINNFEYHDQLLNMHRFLTRSFVAVKAKHNNINYPLLAFV